MPVYLEQKDDVTDQLFSEIVKLKVNLLKESVECLGIDLKETSNNAKYMNYTANNPLVFEYPNFSINTEMNIQEEPISPKYADDTTIGATQSDYSSPTTTEVYNEPQQEQIAYFPEEYEATSIDYLDANGRYNWAQRVFNSVPQGFGMQSKTTGYCARYAGNLAMMFIGKFKLGTKIKLRQNGGLGNAGGRGNEFDNITKQMNSVGYSTIGGTNGYTTYNEARVFSNSLHPYGGDVVHYQSKNGRHFHIAFFNGVNWVSDFVQRNAWVYNKQGNEPTSWIVRVYRVNNFSFA